MIFEIAKGKKRYKHQYDIVSDGIIVAIVHKKFIHRYTKKIITYEEFRNSANLSIIWSNGWTVEWTDGKIEHFKNLVQLAQSYTFDNYPGPRNVLRPNKNHKYIG